MSMTDHVRARARFYLHAPETRWLRFALLLFFTALTLVFRLAKAAETPGTIGYDFHSYWMGVERLADLGQPYNLELLAGPMDGKAYDAYRYPPLLAQMLLPLRPLGEAGALIIWLAVATLGLLAAQLVALRIVAPRAHRSIAVVSLAILLISVPGYSAFAQGSLSLLLALPVALALTPNPRLGLFASAVSGFLKIAPGATVLPLLAAHAGLRSKLAGLSIAGIVGAVFALAAPSAWSSFVTALPNIVGTNDPIGYGANPAALARAAGLVSIELPLRLVGLTIAALLFIWGLRLARDPGRRHAALAAALVGSFLVPWIWWDHYLLAISPIALVTWLAGGTAARRELLGALALMTFGFTLFGFLPVAPAAFLILDAARRTHISPTA